jgi:CHAT domain-containing protein/tetratricopeptide (TPR) repeat protein
MTMRLLLALVASAGLAVAARAQDLPEPTEAGLKALEQWTRAAEAARAIRAAPDKEGGASREVADADAFRRFLKENHDLLTPLLRETLIRRCPHIRDQDMAFHLTVMRAVGEETTDRRLLAFATLFQGDMYRRRENFAPAVGAFREAAKVFAALKGHGEWEAACSTQIGEIYELQGRRDLALGEFRHALDLYKQRLGAKDPLVAASLQSIGTVLADQGKAKEAMQVLEEAAEILRAAKEDPHAGLSMVYTSMAFIHWNAGRLRQAQELLEKALQNRIDQLGKNHPETAKANDNLGDLFRDQGEYERALACYQAARAVFEHNDQTKTLDAAINLSCMAQLYTELEDEQKVLQLEREALDVYRRVLSEKHPRVLTALVQVAGAYARCGEYGRALDCALESLRIRRELNGARHVSVVVGLSHVGYAYSRLRDYDRARGYYGQALKLALELPDCPPYEIGAQHNNLGHVYSQTGNIGQAIAEYQEAGRIFEKIYPADHPNLAVIYGNLAMEHVHRKEFDAARDLLQRALTIDAHRFGQRHPAVAERHHNLAALYHEQGNAEEALRELDQAVRSLRRTPGAGPEKGGMLRPGDVRGLPLTLRVFALRGQVLEGTLKADSSRENVAACADNYALLMRLAEQMRRQGLDTQTAKLALGEQVADAYPRLLLLDERLFRLDGEPAHLAAAFSAAELGTARVFLESYGQSRSLNLGHVSPELHDQEMFWRASLRRVEDLLQQEQSRPVDARDAERVGQLQAEDEQLQKKLAAHIARLERDFPQYAALKYPRPCSLDDARRCLSPSEVALVFLPGMDQSAVLLLDARPPANDPTGGLSILPLPNSGKIADKVAALVRKDSLQSVSVSRELGADLYDLLLKPLAARIRGKDLLIVPNGHLCFLPFELLVEGRDDDHEGSFLLEKHRIRYAPSLTALHVLRLWEDARRPPDRSLWAMGDPIYDLNDPRRAPGASLGEAAQQALRELRLRESPTERGGATFPRLVHSAIEVQTLAALLAAPPESIRLGAQATKTAVQQASEKGDLARYRYVHFAVHGVLGRDAGQQPALVLTRVGMDDAARGEGKDDGLLRLEEVLQLKLNADLVVLSACESGKGALHRGEGVTGLARAFLYAGSRGVVCSLWNVDDAVTSEFMSDLYQDLRKGKPAPDALREAQLQQIHRGRAPLYWAPFILIGM